MIHTSRSMDLQDRQARRKLLDDNGPVCLVIKGTMRPVGELDRFQPAGFPEIGHVIYDAPRPDGSIEKVCILDSPASMANHLESVCMDGPACGLHPDLEGLPYVRCVTDRTRNEPSEDDSLDTVVCTSLTEGHRLASDYFLDGLAETRWMPSQIRVKKGKEETLPAHWDGKVFRDELRSRFGLIEVAKDRKDKTYFIPLQSWWAIYQSVFAYDPNSLIHGIMFAKEQIKISRFMTAHLEAFGAGRVGRSGVKFDRLGKTASGQPIFSVDEETAREIRATFILDLSLLRSYGRNENGLSFRQKFLLFDLALWKIERLLRQPFRFRTGCFLEADTVTLSTESETVGTIKLPSITIKESIEECQFAQSPVTSLYYPSEKLYKSGSTAGESSEEESEGMEDSVDSLEE